MSAIIAHMHNENIAIPGGIRGAWDLLFRDIFMRIMKPAIYDGPDKTAGLRSLLPPGHCLLAEQGYEFENLAECWLRGRMLHADNLEHPFLVLDGRRLLFFATVLNTVVSLGSDALTLAARLHGQCELHCYVEYEDFYWFADMLRKSIPIFRAQHKQATNQLEWLEHEMRQIHRKKGLPVVFSYSVTNPWPNALDCNVSDGAWAKMDRDRRWSLGTEALRSHPEKRLRIGPDEWDGYQFDYGLSAFDLLARIE
jgi:hypothetical protein